MFVASFRSQTLHIPPGRAMNRVFAMFLLSVCAVVCSHSPAWSQGASVVTLTRLDCGTNAAPTDVGGRMSDTYAYSGLKVQLTFSCYLIKHGDDYMVWD